MTRLKPYLTMIWLLFALAVVVWTSVFTDRFGLGLLAGVSVGVTASVLADETYRVMIPGGHHSDRLRT